MSHSSPSIFLSFSCNLPFWQPLSNILLSLLSFFVHYFFSYLFLFHFCFIPLIKCFSFIYSPLMFFFFFTAFLVYPPSHFVVYPLSHFVVYPPSHFVVHPPSHFVVHPPSHFINTLRLCHVSFPSFLVPYILFWPLFSGLSPLLLSSSLPHFILPSLFPSLFLFLPCVFYLFIFISSSSSFPFFLSFLIHFIQPHYQWLASLSPSSPSSQALSPYNTPPPLH